MRIYSMTATFGKLEHQTLTLEPGLNVIHAPNEWGKSTWCAFLVAMLYGIATKERTKLGSIADKERYAPWSGSPMSGRMDLCWNGRDITIERRTKGRAIFGDFKAYETATGLPVPELTAATCGQVLLGVEKSVFTRAGFIRLTDLPVSDDEALRRRLNALVTTGDESGASDALEQKLRDLKNHCRYNKSGLLPQAEAQRDELSGKLQQLQQLQTQLKQLRTRREELDGQIKALDNHRTALAFEASQADAQRVLRANEAAQKAQTDLQALQDRCALLPDRQSAQHILDQLQALQLQWAALHEEVIPPAPEAPSAPAPFAGMDAAQAVQQATSDRAAYTMLCKKLSPVPLILAAASLLAGIALVFFTPVFAIPCGLLAAGLVGIHLRNRSLQRRDRENVAARYCGLEPEQWLPLAQGYQDSDAAYRQDAAAHAALLRSREERRESLKCELEKLTSGEALADTLRKYREVLAQQDALVAAQTAYRQARDHAEALAAVAKVAVPPAFADTLTLSARETDLQLSNAAAEHRQLHHREGQYLGQMEALGQQEQLQRQLAAVQARIDRLEDIYRAVTVAMQTLTQAANQLQRKFAPRISQRAQTLFARLTGGRYDRLLLGEDLSVSAGAQDEDTLRSGLWRSDGTADQQYLALRLAVAEELTPQAPLVLDDALVRFDETRLALAMDILKEEAGQKQVIVFTCQGREKALL